MKMKAYLFFILTFMSLGFISEPANAGVSFSFSVGEPDFDFIPMEDYVVIERVIRPHRHYKQRHRHPKHYYREYYCYPDASCYYYVPRHRQVVHQYYYWD